MSVLTPRWRVALHYGALSGIGSFLIFLAIHFKGNNPLGITSWLGAWIPVVFICLATKYFRDRLLGGYITYGSAFLTGVQTVLCASVLFAFLVYIFGIITQAAFLQLHIEEMLQSLEEAKMFLSKEVYETTLEKTEKMTLGEVVYQDFFGKMLGGIIVSLFTAAFYRKNPDIEL